MAARAGNHIAGVVNNPLTSDPPSRNTYVGGNYAYGTAELTGLGSNTQDNSISKIDGYEILTVGWETIVVITPATVHIL